MIPFPLKFLRWRTRMLLGTVRSRPEYLALGAAGAALGLSGSAAMASRLGEGFVDLVAAGPDDLERALDLGGLTLFLIITLMALANVITRFFGDGRLAERENLMGPLPPGALFATELLDAYRLPLLFIVAFGLAPLTVGAAQAHIPLSAIASTWLTTLMIFLQPTLLVMGGAIAVVRFLPRALMGRSGLLFGVMLAGSLLLFSGIGAIRGLLRGAAINWLSLSPSHLFAVIIPGALRGESPYGLPQLAAAALSTTVLFFTVRGLYTHLLLSDLDRFRLTAAPSASSSGRRSLLFGALARLAGRPIAAIVIKDLRSSRRDTAQRIALTLMAALVSALVIGDLLSGSRLSPLFGPIFFAYALFLVATQGLSTFSSEGGMLENLARLPLGSDELLRAKVLSHFLLFMAVAGVVVALLLIAPVPLPWVWQALVALMLGAAFVPVAGVLAILTVTLGAIFPKPGEGGAQKEISIFAMGLFLHLGGLMAVCLGASLTALALGPFYAVVPVVVAAIWVGVLALLWHLARRAIAQAMGTNLREE